MPTKQEFLDFFFEASLNGWAGNAPEITLPELPGFKVIQWPRNGQPGMPGWFYRDAYTVNQGTKVSAGFTNIWKNGVPQFMHTYGGHYPKHVIEFLKKVLRETYSKQHFLGGRGLPSLDLDYDLEYDLCLTEAKDHSFQKKINEIQNYSQFSGTEIIRDLKGYKTVGYHTIWCMTLF